MTAGRPTDYSQELVEIICTRIADGESLRAICRDEGMPAKGTVFRWIAQIKEFQDQYEAAMVQRSESMFEDILEIADDTSRDTIDTENGEKANSEWISRSRLRVDARKWMLSKMVPKKYGERLAIGGADDMPPIKTMSDTELAAKIAAMTAKANVEPEQD